MEPQQMAAPSAAVRSTKPTPRAGLDRAVRTAKEKAKEFARLGPAEKARLLRECVAGVRDAAEQWVRRGCDAKGIDFDAPVAGEEWLAGPVVTARNARLLACSLDQIASQGRPRLKLRQREDGRLVHAAFPTSGLDGALFAGFRADVLLEAGVGPDTASAASFYGRQDPEGELALVLGAGNVSSIPPMDAFAMMFIEGCACVLKMNPVNDWVGPALEMALAPLIGRGYLQIVYGGADEGAYLCGHAEVDRIHITGSDKTHDLIVWGPPGPARDRRKRDNDPLCRKRVTSELGNVSPVVIVPGDYAAEELRFMAANIAAMVGNNGSFNCNAAKILVTSSRWPQAEDFRGALMAQFFRMPPRLAYYPGASDRWHALTDGRGSQLTTFGVESGGVLPWAFISGLDPEDRDEPLFRVEPFCGLLSETALPEADPAGFLRKATAFCNQRLWGTLNCSLMVAPSLERDAQFARELERAITDLRYGTVAINHWPALGYGFVSPPWGGHPSATLADIQSGLGWVHNTAMLERVEKTIVRGPFLVKPKPAWFLDNRRSHVIGRKLVRFEAAPSIWQVPGIALTALRG